MEVAVAAKTVVEREHAPAKTMEVTNFRMPSNMKDCWGALRHEKDDDKSTPRRFVPRSKSGKKVMPGKEVINDPRLIAIAGNVVDGVMTFIDTTKTVIVTGFKVTINRSEAVKEMLAAYTAHEINLPEIRVELLNKAQVSALAKFKNIPFPREYSHKPNISSLLNHDAVNDGFRSYDYLMGNPLVPESVLICEGDIIGYSNKTGKRFFDVLAASPDDDTQRGVTDTSNKGKGDKKAKKEKV